MNFKIQSISDVITNSSTEVFIVIHYSDIEAIKNIVNAILRIDSDLKFDDLFEASFEVEEYALEHIFDFLCNSICNGSFWIYWFCWI